MQQLKPLKIRTGLIIRFIQSTDEQLHFVRSLLYYDILYQNSSIKFSNRNRKYSKANISHSSTPFCSLFRRSSLSSHIQNQPAHNFIDALEAVGILGLSQWANYAQKIHWLLSNIALRFVFSILIRRNSFWIFIDMVWHLCSWSRVEGNGSWCLVWWLQSAFMNIYKICFEY